MASLESISMSSPKVTMWTAKTVTMYHLKLIFMPNTDIVDTNWYDQADTETAIIKIQSGRLTADIANSDTKNLRPLLIHTEISKHDIIKS